MRAAGAFLVTAAVMATTVAAPAAAEDVGLGAASQAGRVTLGAPKTHAFTAIDASCVRASRSAKVADCTVRATDEVRWTGTATVTRGKRSYRVEYSVSG